jgi:hypothetical protein
MREGLVKHAAPAASEPSLGNVPPMSLSQRHGRVFFCLFLTPGGRAALGASLNTSRLSDVLGPRNKEAAGQLDDPTEENEALSEDLQLLAHRLERECFYIIFKVRFATACQEILCANSKDRCFPLG